MSPKKPSTLLGAAALIALAALAVVGLGGGGGSATAAPAHAKTTSHPKTASGPRATVKVAKSGLGKILVDSKGRTLYRFTRDSGKKSACTGTCATAWPPLITNGRPAVSGAKASLVGTTTRSNGTTQVTYKGHPLYRFVKDTKPGDTNGQGLTAFGGHWFTVTAAGNEVSARAAKPAPVQPPQPVQPAPTPQPQPVQPAPGNGIPQNGGGDGDLDNHGGPSDGDGDI